MEGNLDGVQLARYTYTLTQRFFKNYFCLIGHKIDIFSILHLPYIAEVIIFSGRCTKKWTWILWYYQWVSQKNIKNAKFKPHSIIKNTLKSKIAPTKTLNIYKKDVLKNILLEVTWKNLIMMKLQLQQLQRYISFNFHLQGVSISISQLPTRNSFLGLGLLSLFMW